MNVLRKLLPVSDSKPAVDLTLPTFADHFPAEMRDAMYALWTDAIDNLEADLGTHARPNLTWREIYRNTDANGVRRRDPVRPAPPKPEGDALKKARGIAHTKMILARNAAENAALEYESLGGNRDDSEA
jgi:hypothetical protein